MSEPAMVDIDVPDADAMRQLGERIAPLLTEGDVLILNGPLGAGKTTLVQGIARGLGVSEAVTSPTFVISHMHNGAHMMLIHVDAYRLSDPRDLASLDLDEYLDRAVTVVEWGRNVWSDDNSDLESLTISRCDDTERRTVSLPSRLAAAADRGI